MGPIDWNKGEREREQAKTGRDRDERGKERKKGREEIKRIACAFGNGKKRQKPGR